MRNGVKVVKVDRQEGEHILEREIRAGNGLISDKFFFNFLFLSSFQNSEHHAKAKLHWIVNN